MNILVTITHRDGTVSKQCTNEANALGVMRYWLSIQTVTNIEVSK